MKRFIALLLLAVICSPVFAADNDDPVPYSTDEFPPWLRELRRAEIIMIGSLPITILVAGLGYSLYQSLTSETETEFSFFSGQTDTELEEEEKILVLKITFSLSGIIALTDWIIGKVRPEEE